MSRPPPPSSLPASTPGRRHLAWLASVLFFASGFTGLAYEVIWFKQFSHVWGSSTLATAAVVGSFLLGLGVGAHTFGRFADRVTVPIFWYGVFEIVIAALALLIPLEIRLLGPASAALYPKLADTPLLHYFARLALTFLVIGPPTFLMGGTLPLMVRQFTRASAGLRGSTSWLYAVNTLGAATGCYVAGFHLLSRFGLAGTNGITAASNLAIGIVAILAARNLGRADEPDEHEPEDELAMRATSLAARSPLVLYAIAALTGFAALVLQIVWVRQLALVLGGTTYAFTAVLFVVLVGIGLGSFAFRLVAGRSLRLEYAPVLAIGLLVLTTAIGQSQIDALTRRVAELGSQRASEVFNALSSVAASSVLELVPALVMGLLFPFLVHLTRASVAQAGRAVGRIYAVNTGGSILGASLTSALVVPALGSTGAVQLALAAYAAALFALFPRAEAWTRWGAPMSTAALVAIAFLGVSPHDPRITNGGGFLYGRELMESMAERSRVLMFEEGPMTSVLVTEIEGQVYLRVDGKIDATSGVDMINQLGASYFAHMLRPDARDVFIIGYGSGSSAGASCLFPGTRVVCCEIEPAVYAASQYFRHVNHDPPARDNFTMVMDDGRSYLPGTDQMFDLIISEPSNPWIPGIASLFTKEFYESVRSKLRPGGMIAQWIQIYDFELSEYALIARTLREVFPHVVLMRNTGLDTVLLASMEPIVASPEVMDRAQAGVDASPEIQADLATYFGSTDVRALLLRHGFLDGAGIQRLIDRQGPGGGLNTDVNMRLAFDAPRRIFRDRTVSERPAVDAHILATADAEHFATRFRSFGATPDRLASIVSVAALFSKTGRLDEAKELMDVAAAAQPADPRIAVERTALQLALSRSGDAPAGWDGLDALSVEDATEVGVRLWDLQVYPAAAELFARLVPRAPESPRVHASLGISLQHLRRWDEAEAAFAKAQQVDPNSPEVKQLYRGFRLERQRLEGR